MLIAMGSAKHLKVRRTVPVNSPVYSGRLGPAFYTDKTVTYNPVGTGAGPTETMKYQLFVPGTYSNSVPHRLIVHFGNSGTRSGTGQNDNNNTSQMSGRLPAIVQASPSTWPTLVAFGQLPNIAGPNPGSRLSHFGMQGPLIDSVASEWNVDRTRVYYVSWSQGSIFGLEALAYAPNASLYAAMACAAGDVFGTLGVGVNLLDASVTTDAAAAVRVAAALGNTPLWMYSAENAPGSGTDGVVGFTQAQQLRDAIVAAGNTHYANPGSATNPGWVDVSLTDHSGTENIMIAQTSLFTTMYTLHR